jgi:hypothetical protein
MIYERIPTSTSTYELEYETSTPKSPARVTLRIPSLPVSLLATCRLINREAGPILVAKAAAFNTQPIHITLTSAAVHEFFDDKSPLLSERLRLYSRRLDAVMTHGKQCAFYSFYYGLSNYLAHCSPSATVLFVDRDPYDDGAEPVAELIRALQQESHWMGMPAPVRVQVPKSDLSVVRRDVFWDLGYDDLIRRVLQQWGVETVESA